MEQNAYLKNLLSGRELFHAYIISGEDEGSRLSTAMELAAAAVCSSTGNAPCGECRNCIKAAKNLHPDITVIKREKDEKEITVDTIRQIRTSAIIMPNEADRSVYIICDADTMNPSAQNAMLKILEEPPKHVVFILLANNAERLLDTVRSRCEIIRLLPLQKPDSNPIAEKIIDMAVCGDNLGMLHTFTESVAEDRAALREFLADLRRSLAKRMRSKDIPYGMFLALTETIDTADKYIDANVNTGHIIGFLLAGFIKD